MKIIKVLLSFIFLALVACSNKGSNHIEVRNVGGLPLRDVEVDVGGRKYNIDIININAKRIVEFDPISDSGVRIKYKLGDSGGRRSCEGDIYVTTGVSVHITTVIDAIGACEFKVDDD